MDIHYSVDLKSGSLWLKCILIGTMKVILLIRFIENGQYAYFAYLLLKMNTSIVSSMIYCIYLFRTFQVHINFNIDDSECNTRCNSYGA